MASKVSIFHCWTCGERLEGDRPYGCFFWCSDEHRDTYEAKIKASVGGDVWKKDEPNPGPRTIYVDDAPQKKKKRKSSKKSKKAAVTKRKSTKSPSRRRIRQIGEAAAGGSTKQYTCGICGRKGHNARTCKEGLN